MQGMVAGIDEVGRGPLIGAVVAAAVILQSPIEGLMDSKQLSAKRREELALIIQRDALCYAFGEATPAEIDALNIHHATLLAMKRALENLSIQPTYVYVDGKFLPDMTVQGEAVVKGDSLIPSISAASIIAKVKRDSDLILLHEQFPAYDLLNNKGYPTPKHLKAIQMYGITSHHRQSFRPVAAYLDKEF